MNELLLRELNMSITDYQEILRRIGRDPEIVELGLFSAMWSEHCSYRSSKKYLKLLPVHSKKVVQGPGENAGVIQLQNELCLVFKVESHNHPSAVEPFQGAATGVGGIIRDIFTMGARPIAVMDSLSFDYPDQPRARYLLHGVVDGISFYGNCVGVPNLGGETHFDSCYQENPLVNVMCAGLLERDQLRSSVARSIGAPVIYIGAKTGRDGIHGASFASGVLDEEAKKRKSSVQVGDPFLEKLLIEATLEIIRNDLIEAIQDMGAAGLTSSSVEMAGKGEKGIELHLEKVPLREPDINPFEMMLSESQERMLLIAKPDKTHEIKAILEKWQLDYAEIGHITDSGNISIYHHDKLLCDIPIKELLDAPDNTVEATKDPLCTREIVSDDLPSGNDWKPWILDYASKPAQGTKNWIFEQYDTTLLSNTVQAPGNGPCLVHIKDSNLHLGFSLNSYGSWSALDPYEGVMAVLSMSSRRLSALGTAPVAITNCLNFGDPMKSHTAWEFSQTIQGMKKWLEFFEVPVVSGNVSFYNEGENTRIFPTPVIGMVSQSEDLEPLSPILQTIGLELAILGSTQNERFKGKTMPKLDLATEKATQECLRQLIKEKKITFARSLDHGGLMRCLLSCIAGGSCGICVEESLLPLSSLEFFFSESHSRFLVAYPTQQSKELAGIFPHLPIIPIGRTIPEAILDIPNAKIPLAQLREFLHKAFAFHMDHTYIGSSQ
jgi:phosphoribosylformylglycinamidine synthase